MACNRRSGCHLGAQQMGARVPSLPANEIPVRGRRAALELANRFAVRAETHRATRFAPFESGLFENDVGAFPFRLRLNQAGSRNDPAAHAFMHLAACRDRRCAAQVLDPSVRAGADENTIDCNRVETVPGLEVHIFERALHALAPFRARGLGWIRNGAVDRSDILWTGAPCHHWGDLRTIETDLAVETRLKIGRKLAPAPKRPVPFFAFRRVGPPSQIGESGLIRRDHSCTRAGLDRHVADGETPLHRQTGDRRARIFDHMPCRASRADPADNGENDIFGAHASAEPPIDGDAHRLWHALPKRLGRQDVVGFGHSKAKGEGADRAMRRSMAVCADDDHSGLADALFGTNDVYDAVPLVLQAEHLDAKVGGVLRERLHHVPPFGVGDLCRLARIRRHVVIRRRECLQWRMRFEPARRQEFEGRGVAVVNEMAINVEQSLAVRPLKNAVSRPDLLEHGASRCGRHEEPPFSTPSACDSYRRRSSAAKSYLDNLSSRFATRLNAVGFVTPYLTNT